MSTAFFMLMVQRSMVFVSKPVVSKPVFSKSVITLVLVSSTPALGAEPVAPLEPTQSIVLEHTLRDGESRRFPILIDRPIGFESETGQAVMLFHGGYQSDPHWTVPGSYTINDKTYPLTIDGNDTRDADTIAQACIESGIAVIRYGSIHLDDAKHKENPVMGDSIGFNDTVDLAAAVWERALGELDIASSQCTVIAHSLGAPRSIYSTIGEHQPAGGYVFLAGAYASPTMEQPKSLIAQAAEKKIDKLDIPDHDGSGTIDAFEQAAHLAITQDSYRGEKPFASESVVYPWLCDELIVTDAPVLAIWGSIDPMSYHGPVLSNLFQDAGKENQLTSVYGIGLGHNLSEEDSGKVGPIDQRVVEQIVEWVKGSSKKHERESD
jgi:pimeloyl-ACP methyl ester carboxylesterase